MPQLLVSVVSVQEAEEALAGGADLIDVKDPSRGSLGRADDEVLAAIRDHVAGRRPISAALGEFADFRSSPPPGFDFVKCGLAGLGGSVWGDRPYHLQERTSACVVHVAYADWRCAQAPPIDEVLRHALRFSSDAVMLVDTCCKDADSRGRRPTLLDWLPLADVASLIAAAHEGNVRIALAGSLGLAEIAELVKLGPDWIAVRAAACDSSRRDGAVRRDAVRRLKLLTLGEASGRFS